MIILCQQIWFYIQFVGSIALGTLIILIALEYLLQSISEVLKKKRRNKK